MKNLKVAFFSSLIIFLCHYLFGVFYTSFIDRNGINWMNPFLMFLTFYWVYFSLTLLHIFLIKKTRMNNWIIAFSLMVLVFIGVYSPFILEGSFIKNFKWITVITLLITTPLLVYISNYFIKKTNG
ncbi:hypothetical protein MATR_06250 [Marivirga tractuosa]|uniref:Uncharacterized protein n=1 Tax=Marivirga tractuosa (strain ATCC 23168 / DSM 4126 / NBRC 15989 / NCIMB 1408 / VKM B-1430 / H-43) TaxID=643867 RepID=E4TRM1_MARTH|nr:hypothetical protein Ftrac_1754 [Marivirga tractuosa DSM 4126]BDD13800.1 hypothetical protein MATR_06250 [Marivirga tractuosa]